MRLIYLFPKYTRAGASSRYRSFQYLPSFVTAGLAFKVYPLFNDRYVLRKYKNLRVPIIELLSAFVRRLWTVLNIPSGTVVFIEYELIPYFPLLLERWLKWRNCHIILDYDDALFHQYDNHRSYWIRFFLGSKIAKVMQLADTVIVGNSYLAKYAHTAGVKQLKIIPTVIDLDFYRTKNITSNQNVLIIGWIGSPSTAKYLKNIALALGRLSRSNNILIRLIGSGPIEIPGIEVEIIGWQEEYEVNEICSFDIGIMPLPDEPWAKGKCGFKLIQYMACGLPVVASPIGVNCEIVENGINGYLASTTEEWVDALQSLINDEEKRKEMGALGRQHVEAKYCLAATAPKLIEILTKCAASQVF